MCYNLRTGGLQNVIISEEARNNLSKAHIGKENFNKKKVYCFELNKTFNSLTEASKYLNVSCGLISRVCSKKNITTFGYHLCYLEDKDSYIFKNKKTNKGKHWATEKKGQTPWNKGKKMTKEFIKKSAIGHYKMIYCIELDKLFNSVKEAAEYVNKKPNTLSTHLKGKSKTCGGYHFKYYEE